MSTYTPHLLTVGSEHQGSLLKYFNVPHSSRRNSNPLHKAYRTFALWCLALHPPLLIAFSHSPFQLNWITFRTPLVGFLPGLLPVFSYSYFTVSSDGCWMHGFSPWVLQQARSTTIIPISQMRKQSLTNLRTLNSPTQLLSGGVEWKLSDLTLELSLGCPSRTLDCELNLANVCDHLDSTPSRESSPAGPHALLEFVHSAPSVCPLIALITYARHQRFVFLSVSPTNLGDPRISKILHAHLALSPTVAKKPGIHQVPSALRSVNFAPRFLSMPCHWKPCASLTEFRFKEELVTSPFGGI